MNIWLVIVVIVVISIIFSVLALRDLENRSHIDKTQKKLFRGRVVFQDSSSDKQERSSSSSPRSL